MDQDRGFHGGVEVSAVKGSEDGLRVELKLLGDATGASSPLKVQAFSHGCHLCNKGFNSGKALGGHMRMHYEANRLLTLGSAADQTAECRICGREFSSVKGVYGHMRSHPGRPWKGIQPPEEETNKPASSAVKIDDLRIAVDSPAAAAPAGSASSLPTSWSVTSKRGRKTTASSASSGSSNGVHNKPENSAATVEFDGKERTIDELCHAIDGASSDRVGSSKRKLQLKTAQEKNAIDDQKLSPDIQTSDDESAEGEHLNSDDEMGRKKMRKVKRIKEIGELNFPGNEKPEDHPPAGSEGRLKNPIPKNKHRCSICKKVFPSHQAMGGHKASHFKPKKTLAINPLLPSEEGGAAMLMKEPGSPEPKPEAEQAVDGGGSARNSTYQIINMTIIACKVCGSSVGATEAQTSQVTSVGESTQTGRKMLNFDLNELPPPEEGEGESCSPHDHHQHNK